jgi:hypothetical protein
MQPNRLQSGVEQRMSQLSSYQMEKQLELIPLHYIHYSYTPVEYGKGVYKGIEAYGWLRETQPHMMPTEKDFCNAFIQRTINCFPIEKLMKDYEKYRLGLECRAKRAYRSLVREEHCTQRMMEMYPKYGIEVFYDNDDDWKKGIDVTLKDTVTGRVQYVHLFVESASSRKHLKSKATRGEGRDFSNHVMFPFVREKGKKAGDFYLYSDKQILDFMTLLRTDYKKKGDKLA